MYLEAQVYEVILKYMNNVFKWAPPPTAPLVFVTL